MTETLVKTNGIAKHLQLRRILLDIIGENYSIGQRFYSERELMRMFKVSSLTVSRAMKSLESDGIVERKIGGGTFIMKSGDAVSALTNTSAPFVLYLNVPLQKNIADIDPLNWFISSEIQRGIINSFTGQTKMLNTPDLLNEIEKSPNSNCILVSPTESEFSTASKFAEKLIAIDVDSLLKPATNCIKWECLSGVYQLVSYFIQSGHSKIALIAGNYEIHKQRIAGFRIACDTLGITCPDKYTKLVDSGTKQAGAKAVLELLELGEDRPTAVFVDTDIKAEGAIEAVTEAGYNVPEDISIAGFDDIPDAKYSKPALTTVKVPYYEMGVQAVRMLKNKKKTFKECFTMKTELVIRDSTSCLKQ